MAKVYRAPIDPPAWEEYEVDGRMNMQKMDEVDAAYIAALAEMARNTIPAPTNDLIGKVIRFQVADGYAQYMVWKTKPLSLIHLGLHDGYEISEAHERGLNLADVKAMVERDKRMAELFKTS